MLRLAVLIISFNLSLIFYHISLKWVFSVILLVYLGGIIILFIYVAILRIEDKLNINQKMSLRVAGLVAILLFSDPRREGPHKELSQSEIAKFSDLYRSSNLGLLLILMAYLLLTLFCVVKVTESFKGTIVKSAYV